MEKRQYGEYTTLETRAEANESIDRNKRYQQIIEIFTVKKNEGVKGLTARQTAEIMRLWGYTPTSERNWSAPRITELCQKGILEPIGKDYCIYTGKKVTVYALTEVM